MWTWVSAFGNFLRTASRFVDISQSTSPVSMVMERRMRHWDLIICSSRSISAALAGCCMVVYLLTNFRNSSELSQSSTSVLTAVRPCLTELRADFWRVSGVFGPRDLAPLIRAVSDLNSDGILLLLCSGYPANRRGEFRSIRVS